MNQHVWWYVARASGMVAAVLLASTVVWGLLASTRLLRRPGLPAWLVDLHRGLGGLTAAFVAVHLASLVADGTVHFGWAELLVPFASTWRRGAVAMGVAAFWGLVIVEGSSLIQRRMARTTWRRLHLLSYPVALLVALHAATAGTDAGNPLFIRVSIVSIAAVCLLTVVRIVRSTMRPRRRSARSGQGRPSGRAAPSRRRDVGGASAPPGGGAGPPRRGIPEPTGPQIRRR
jgi:DMSO/TMAO reductase YedYZ heme-binding membrane subunit